MTITSTQNRVSYAGNGAPGVPGTLVFAVPFRFLAISDLVVLVRVDATGVDTTKTLDTDYSVAGEGAAAGGTVTFLIEDQEPQTGETLIIYGNPPMTQAVDYISGGTFPAETHEEALDKVTLQGIRTRELAERALSLLDSSTDGSGQYDANGNRISTLGTPTATTDATTKTYVDALVNNTALGPAPTGLIATGSVTSRLLSDRWGEVINVKDFGAVGNGVADDTAAIAAALAAGNRIHFPPGSFRITSGISVTGGKTLNGDNATILKDFDGVGVTFTGGATYNYVTGSLTVEASAAQTANTAVDNSSSTAHGVLFSNNRIRVSGRFTSTKHKGHGFHFNCTAPNMNKSDLLDIWASYNGRSGLRFEGTNDNASVIRLGIYSQYNREAGVYFASDFMGRQFDGFIYAETNARDGSSDQVYLGKLRSSRLFVYAEENTYSSTGYELNIGANCINLEIFDTRDNETLNGSPQTCRTYQGGRLNARGDVTYFGHIKFENLTNNAAKTGTLEYESSVGVFAHDKLYGNYGREFLIKNATTGVGAITRMESTGVVRKTGYGAPLSLGLRSFNGTIAAPTTKLTTENAATIDFEVGTGSADSFNAANIEARITSVGGGNKASADVVISTTPNGSGTKADAFSVNQDGSIKAARGPFVPAAIVALDNTGTPAVSGGNVFITGGIATITDFDNGVLGQTITVLAEHGLIITDGTHIILHGSANFTMAASDSLTLVLKADNKWYETARMVN